MLFILKVFQEVKRKEGKMFMYFDGTTIKDKEMEQEF